MPKKIIVNVLLLISSAAIALLLCEGIIRAFNLAPEIVYVEKWRVRLSENRKIGYEPIPNLDSRGQSAQFYSYIGRSNSMGYRDYDHPLKKPPGSQRVIVLGDSVTAGLWIEGDDKIFTSVMEKQLQQAGYQVDVMNFGVSGYNTSQEVETLKVRGLPFNPDVVVLAYCLNDRYRDDGNIYGILLEEERRSSQTGKINTAKINALERHSALLRFIRYMVIGVRSGSAARQRDSKVEQFYSDSVEQSFRELAQLANAHEFQVLVAVFPNFGERDKGLEAPYQYQEEHETVAALAAQYNFHHLDLLEPFRECKAKLPSRHTISFDRYHPNVEGNHCAGSAIADAAKELLTH